MRHQKRDKNYRGVYHLWRCVMERKVEIFKMMRNAPFKKEDGHQKCIMNALHDPTHQEEFRCRKNKMVE